MPPFDSAPPPLEAGDGRRGNDVAAGACTDPVAALDRALDRFPAIRRIDRSPGVVAFSGGPDSTALLLALARRRRRRGGPPLLAAHLDHTADPGSRERARRAAALARRLGVPFVEHRLPLTAPRRAGEGRESAARRHRYAFLARVASDAGAGWIATGHHRDDQAETVVLRLAFGSGLRGLAGVAPVGRLPRTARATAGRWTEGRWAEGEPILVRPLLGLPRSTLAAALERPATQATAETAPEGATPEGATPEDSAPEGVPRDRRAPEHRTTAPGDSAPGDSAPEEAARNRRAPERNGAPAARAVPAGPPTAVAAEEGAPLRPALDPTNRDPAVPRNRVRHRVLPALERQARQAGEPPLAPRLAALAERVARARRVADRVLAAHLDLRDGPGAPDAAGAAKDLAAEGAGGGSGPAAGTAPRVDRRRLAALPPALLAPALALLHRAAGAPYPPGRDARRELARQLAAAGAVGCDCGDGLRWEGRGDDLVLVPTPEESPPEGFSYILVVPGEVEIRELGIHLQIHPAPVAPWMYRGAPDRAGLALPLSPGDPVTVRNRRPGDRLQPLGAPGSRRLKEVLVDRRLPRERRDRIPLLCLGDEIAWVPGITVADRFRLPSAPPPGTTVWVATLRPEETSGP